MVTTAARAGSNVLSMVSKGISQGSSLGGGQGAVGGAIRPTTAADSPAGPSTGTGSEISDDQLISYLQKTVGGKNVLPVSRTSNQKLNQILIKAGLMK